MCGCPRRGKLGIQTTPWWSPADFERTNNHWIWLRVAIEAEKLIANCSSEGGYWAEAIVVWPTFRSPSLSLILRVTTLVPLLFCSINSSAGRRGHGRVGDDGSLSPLPPPWD